MIRLLSDMTQRDVTIVEIATRLCLVSADALVLIATWRATGGLHLLTHGTGGRAPLTTRVVQDGEYTEFSCRSDAGLTAYC